MQGDVITEAISAFATFLAVIVAIYQEWIRYKLIPPRLKIELHNNEGVVVPSGEGNKTMFFHLKVVNRRKWAAAKNCEVLLVEIKTQLSDMNFSSIPLAVPRKFDWTPAYLNIAGITIYDQAIFDLVKIESDKNLIVPCLNRYYRDVEGDFEGFIKQGEVKRYVIQIAAENVASRKQTFEISWDGVWPEDFPEHLIIKEIVA